MTGRTTPPGGGKRTATRGVDLTNVVVEAGVNEAGDGFVTVTAFGRDVVLIGQLDCETVRTMALSWLSAAEAAEHDAATLRTCRRLELPDELAGVIITEMRADPKRVDP